MNQIQKKLTTKYLSLIQSSKSDSVFGGSILDAVWPLGRTLLDFLPDARWNSNYPCKGKRSPGKEDIADKVVYRLRLNIIYLTISIVYDVFITNFNDLF